jgi:diguanylate cyclase (GGDEF)-like protein
MQVDESANIFERFLGQINELTIAIDSQGTTTWCSVHACRLLRLDVGDSIESVLDPGSINKLAKSLFKVREGEDFVTELNFVVDNRPVLFTAHLFAFRGSIIIMARENVEDEAQFREFSSLLSEFASLQRETDLQKRELTQQGYLLTTLTRELENERRQLVSLIDQLPEGIVIVNDTTGDIRMTNHRIQELWNLPEDPVRIDQIPLWSLDGSSVPTECLPLYRSMKSRKDEGPEDYIICLDEFDRKSIYVQALASPVLDDVGEVAGAAMSIVDITDHVELQDALEAQAFRDPLTQLWNRRGFSEAVDSALEARATTGHAIAVLYVDLDGFKSVNDRLGHEAGDLAIMEVAGRLRKAVRETDEVSRIGGDEYAILLRSIEDRDHIEIVVRRILESLGEPMSIEDQQIRLPGSVGISIGGPDDDIGTSELIRRADLAMYEAKATGSARWAYYHEASTEEVTAPFSLTEEIHHALDAELFEMLYRPVVDLRSGKVREVEIAMFWRSLSDGLLGDDEIRSRSWRAGLLHSIAERAAELAERDRPLMIEALGSRNHIVMSRHYWIEYLREERIIEQLLEIARDIADTPIKVWIELSGRLLPGDDATLARLMSLHNAGMRFSIAHAGDYDGDLGLLRHLPVQSIVASPALVASALEDRRAHKLLRSVVATARVFDVPVKAPGIQSSDELEMVRDLGFDSGSGAFFSRPLTAAQLLDFSIDHVFTFDRD